MESKTKLRLLSDFHPDTMFVMEKGFQTQDFTEVVRTIES